MLVPNSIIQQVGQRLRRLGVSSQSGQEKPRTEPQETQPFNIQEAIKRFEAQIKQSKEEIRDRTGSAGPGMIGLAALNQAKQSIDFMESELKELKRIDADNSLSGRLLKAVLENNSQEVAILLQERMSLPDEFRPDLNQITFLGENRLMHAAVEYGVREQPALEIINQLKLAGVSCNTPNAEGQYPIHREAGFRGRIPVLQALLETSPTHINITDNDGNALLHYAAHSKKIPAIEWLLQQGAKMSLNSAGKTPLDKAMEGPIDTATAMLLVQRGADPFNIPVNIETDELMISTIDHAMIGNEMLFNAILEGLDKRDPKGTGEGLNRYNRKGNTPLILAAVLGNIKAMETLLKHGANPEFMDINQHTPLQRLGMLLQRENDETDLSNAAECIKLLINNGANPHTTLQAKTNEQEGAESAQTVTLLDLAVKNNLSHLTTFLADRGVSGMAESMEKLEELRQEARDKASQAERNSQNTAEAAEKSRELAKSAEAAEKTPQPKGKLSIAEKAIKAYEENIRNTQQNIHNVTRNLAAQSADLQYIAERLSPLDDQIVSDKLEMEVLREAINDTSDLGRLRMAIIEQKKSEAIRLLTKIPAEQLQEVNKKGENLIFLAIRYTNGKPASKIILHELIEKGVNPNQPDIEGNTPLMEAIKATSIETDLEKNVISLLIEKRKEPLPQGHQQTDVNILNRRGNTPLMLAVTHSNPALVQLLCKAGAEVNLFNNEGENALQKALYASEDIEIMKILLRHGANPDAIVDDQGVKEPLLKLADTKEKMKLLLEHGANPNIANSAGEPMLVEILNNEDEGNEDEDIETLEMLLTHGANPNLVYGEDGRTPFMKAVLLTSEKASQIIALFCKNRANLNLADSEGRCPLQIVIEEMGDEDGIINGNARTLIEHGADPNVKVFDYQDEGDGEEKTLAELALKYNNVDSLKFLAAHGAILPKGVTIENGIVKKDGQEIISEPKEKDPDNESLSYLTPSLTPHTHRVNIRDITG